MLSNLVSNAIKFTERGYVHIDAFEVERDAETAVLGFAVSDTGIGIPEDRQDALYVPFSQGDSSTTRQFGGTGLGLSIVRRLAQRMGGDVGVNSHPGEGTCFWFHIRTEPLGPDRDSRRTERLPERQRPVDDSHLQPSRRVLVVEDNATNRMVIVAMLRKQDVAVEVVEDGQQAVAAATRDGERPDLIFMDVQMPVMDGLDATKALRRWEADNGRSRMPIVALTAGAFQEDQNRCAEAGMDDYLAKPISAEDLATVLNRWLDRKAPRTPEAG
jgi:CheY-like chemotaxis protein